MTPDRESVDTVLERDTGGDIEVRDIEVRDAVAEAALMAGPVPAPRPEVLARVLDGLRDLPAARRAPREGTGAGAGDRAMPLPRRRS